MDLKLNQTPEISPKFPNSTCLCRSKSIPNHFYVLAQRWRFQILDKWMNQSSNKGILVHEVKGGENLSSTSKLYGVSVNSVAAANKGILDIPSLSKGLNSKFRYQTKKIKLPRLKKCFTNSGEAFHDKISTMLSTKPLLCAKTSGFFILVIPLVAFCINCVLRVAFRDKNCDITNTQQHNRSTRWKYALSDPETEVASEPIPDSNPYSDNEDRYTSEELSTAYTKLEGDYEKFLSECGMSKWGYWRGGSHD